jgi:hypothetical protein
MKITNFAFAILSLSFLLVGCSRSEPKAQAGRFQLIFTPAQSKAPELIYLIDTATGRVWSMGIKREVSKPDGTSEVEFSEWKEETVIKGLSGNK